MTAPEEPQETTADEPVALPQLIVLDAEDAPVCEDGVCL